MKRYKEEKKAKMHQKEVKLGKYLEKRETKAHPAGGGGLFSGSRR